MFLPMLLRAKYIYLSKQTFLIGSNLHDTQSCQVMTSKTISAAMENEGYISFQIIILFLPKPDISEMCKCLRNSVKKCTINETIC